MIAAFLFSISIEAIQYYLALGLCEVDDVIMNTLGAMIGTLAYFLSSRREWLKFGDERYRKSPVNRKLIEWLMDHQEIRDQLWKKMMDEEQN